MGPEATLDLLRRILDATPARDDQDHIRTLVDNNPKIPSRIDAVIHGHGESPAGTLVKMARGLESLGADFLVMPCNTAHLYAGEIAAAVQIPLISLIEVAVDAALATVANLGKVGLLASSAVHQTGIYAEAFAEVAVTTIHPRQASQDELMDLIVRVKACDVRDEDRLQRVVADVVNQGAECLVLACTELSVIDELIAAPVPIVDASQALAEETVRRGLL